MQEVSGAPSEIDSDVVRLREHTDEEIHQLREEIHVLR
jgi:hypothetical protein